MSRVSDEYAKTLSEITSKSLLYTGEDVINLACDLLDARKERDEARPVLEAAREQVKQSKRCSGSHDGQDDYLMAAYHTERAIAVYDAARARG